MKLIIQIPCYNEEATLGVTIADLPRHIDGIDEIEYLIIDDGSTDRTVEIARSLGVQHIVHFAKNKGLAKGFMAGLDASLRAGADIIVNTDADNQYCGADIEALIRPILEGKADFVVGERPIDETAHFSPIKKKMQHLGSWTVRVASKTRIPDAPSGFRALSREAALRVNVTNPYTYTLETIIQAGHNRTAIDSVKVRTNPELRKSRLFHSMIGYIKRSMVTILRSFMMYKPLSFFGIIGGICIIAGLALGIRFLVYLGLGEGTGHVQSLILTAILLLMGFMTIVIGLQADIIAANRKILEDIQYHVRRTDYEVSRMKEEADEGKKTDLADAIEKNDRESKTQ
ncbi:MAG: glycosyltransferase family 2 protein [Lachnospiraceae bacterium]|nr:glycosyltransferase family 2 protein [Lachnospiraceae bacterium]